MSGERARVQVQRLLDVAEQAIRVDDWDTVLRSARAALRLDPWNADALTYYAAAARSVGLQNDRPENHPPRPVEEEPEPLPAEPEFSESSGQPARPTTIDYAALTERARRQQPRQRRPALWVAAAAASAFGVAVLASAYLIGETSTSPTLPAAVGTSSEATPGAADSPASEPARAAERPTGDATLPDAAGPPRTEATPARTSAEAPATAESPVTTEETDEYEVQPGDSLLAIAGKIGATVAELVELNDLDEGALIFPGDVLLVPASEGEPPAE